MHALVEKGLCYVDEEILRACLFNLLTKGNEFSSFFLFFRADSISWMHLKIIEVNTLQ